MTANRSNRRWATRAVLLAVVWVTLLADPSAAADDEALAAVQGTWVRQQQTPQGVFKVVKVHDGNVTTVTAYDPQGNVYYKHISEFTIDSSGKAATLTFFNRRIVAGPNSGTELKEPGIYIFRVVNDRFYEVSGMLIDDVHPPTVLVWQREKQPD